VKKPQRRFSNATSDFILSINYRVIVRVLPDLDTAYDFRAIVAGPFITAPVDEYNEP
jgi:hypothetical protein